MMVKSHQPIGIVGTNRSYVVADAAVADGVALQIARIVCLVARH